MSGSPTLASRFRSKLASVGVVVRSDLGACLLWTGATNEKGYGVIGAGARGAGVLKVHRVAWELARGPIPEGLFVLHRCDIPACCNVAHLFLGTNADNVADMIAKGRNSPPPVLRGEANPRHRSRRT